MVFFSRIIKREQDYIDAELTIAKGGFKKSFSTRNKADQGGRLTVSLLDGPFSYLEGVWNFMPLREDASKISLDLEFEMPSVLASLPSARFLIKFAIRWWPLSQTGRKKSMAEELTDDFLEIEVAYAKPINKPLWF